MPIQPATPPQAADLLQIESTTLLINISGGVDSQAMTEVLLKARRKNAWRCQVKLVHADLGRMEWHQSMEECQALADRTGLELVIVQHPRFDLLGGIEERMRTRPDAPPFPSSAARFCTAGWKRDQVSKWIRNNIPDGSACINAMGLRADESPARAKKSVWSTRSGAAAPTKRRDVYDWNPILEYTAEDVWKEVGHTLAALMHIRAKVRAWRASGQRGEALICNIRRTGFKAHPAYALGNTRVSCAMCVLANPGDLKNGAEFRPDTHARLLELEKESGFTFQKGRSLADVA